MEEKEKKTRKRKPKAYYYPNGVKTEFVYERKSDKLSAYGLWRQEHPNGLEGEILDMRAVLK
ncbi:MAG: hypothetical protein LBG92_01590 [Prevotellaceae bacterium]|jgi:hypothetical protein|nr:hypothetical protein [Prevotellaceae bacterium]